MGKTALILTMYLIGCAIAYVYTKYATIKHDKKYEWTPADRIATLSLSLLSWLTVALTGIILMADSMLNDKTPAK